MSKGVEDGRKTLEDKENGFEKKKTGCCGGVSSKKWLKLRKWYYN